MKVSLTKAHQQWQKDNQIDPPLFELMRRNKRQTGVGYTKQGAHLGASAVGLLVMMALGATLLDKVIPMFTAFGELGALALSVFAVWLAWQCIGSAVITAEHHDPVAKAKQPKQLSGAVIEIDGKQYVQVR